MDVLFLSVSTGGGHLKAAQALKERIAQLYPLSRTLIVDTLKHVNPFIDKLIIGSYLKALKNSPQIYGKLYDISESGENIYDLSKTVNRILSFRIKRLIYDFDPSVIVCTHPFPLQMVVNLKLMHKVTIPTVAVITDYTAHSFWLHDNVDAYVVANNHMKYEMIDRGIFGDIIFPYGIPVSSDFLQRKNRLTLIKELGLDNKLTVLFMGGSLGYGEIKNNFLSILHCKKDLQIVVVTGSNTKLKGQLEACACGSSKKVLILSYTNRIADLMDISDFIITKPGGMTISEALVKELPIFLISPIPGQEERNAQYLVNNGAAVRIFDNDKLDNILLQIMDNTLRIRHMKEMAKHLAHPNATEDVIGLLKRLNVLKQLTV